MSATECSPTNRHAPVLSADANANGVVEARVDVIAEAKPPLAVVSGEGHCAVAAVLSNQIDARAVVLAAVSQAVVDVRLAAVSLEAGRTHAPEAPEAVNNLAAAVVLAGVTETRVDLVLTHVTVEARQTGARELLEAGLRATSAVETRTSETRVALAHHCRVGLLCRKT